MTTNTAPANLTDVTRTDEVEILIQLVLTLARRAAREISPYEQDAAARTVGGARSALRALTSRRYVASETVGGGWMVTDRWDDNRVIPAGSGLTRRDARDLSSAQNGLNADEIDMEAYELLVTRGHQPRDWPIVRMF